MRKFSVPTINGSLLLLLVFAGTSALAQEKVLYQFPGGNKGDDPQYGLVFDSKGNGYGTTYYGGTYGWGTIFELERSNRGWKEQVLYNFLGSDDGFDPSGNLLIDASGNLYGTTPDVCRDPRLAAGPCLNWNSQTASGNTLFFTAFARVAVAATAPFRAG
jgi:hypothetical protein